MKIQMPTDVSFIIETLYKNGFEAYAVGGCVRDSVLSICPKDWDITTSALPENIMDLFSHTIPTGIKHGTVTVMLNKEGYEVTTYRIDGKYSDNRHPDEVIFTTLLEEDLARRDFTINAMAYNDTKGLIEPFNGLEDLNNKLIRCVGHAESRFKEDALRMIRAIRFSCQLDFSIASDTFNAIKANASLIQNVSFERIREEFSKILLCEKPSFGLIQLKDSGLLKYIIPELMKTVGFDQKNPHHDKDIFLHTLSVIDQSPPELPVRLGALLHDIGKPDSFTLDANGTGHFYGHEIVGTEISEVILKRLKYDNATIKKVLILVKEHMNRFSKLKTSSIKKLMLRVGVDTLEELFSLQTADIKASAPPYDLEPVEFLRRETSKIIIENQPISVKDLKVTGSDLINIGFKPGKNLGEALNYLLQLVLENPELNTKDYLLAHLENYEKNK
jgi:tRNA nucleotidyltransferase (CCA-adding enzyme)